MNLHARKQRGFSLIELMVVLLILSVIMAAVMQQIANVQQRSSAEQTKMDMFQESREFIDQLTRDLHQAGYPNPRNFESGFITGPGDARAAVGLVKVDNGELIFEGDVDGTGVVSSVQYHLDASGNNCPCLKRSQIQKQAGPPYPPQGTAVFQTEVQNVLNGTSATDPIFEAYRSDGTQVTLPVDFAANPATIADINTVKITLKVESKYPDPKTGLKPMTSLVSTVKLANCSQAANSYNMSCR